MQTLNNQTKARLLLLLTFLLGGMAGGWATYLFNQTKTPANARSTVTAIIEEMDRQVQLDELQKAQVAPILRDARQEYRQLYDQLRPQLQSVREGARNRIRPLLRPDQQTDFDAWVKVLDQKREARRQTELEKEQQEQTERNKQKDKHE